MSFSKAKLHRFNEEISCTPPPGAYNPMLDTKVKGPVFEKSKRFLTPNERHSSTESLDSIASTSSVKITGNVPVFRTPQLKRKITPHARSQSVNGRSTKPNEETIENNLREENSNLKYELKSVKEELVLTVKANIDYKIKEDEFKKIIEEKNNILQSQRENISVLKEQCDKLSEYLKLERDNYEKYIKELQDKNDKLSLVQKTLGRLVDEKTALCDTKQDVIVRLENYLCNLNEIMSSLEVKHNEELKTLADSCELNFDNFTQNIQNKVLDLQGDFDMAKMELQVDTDMKFSKALAEFETELKSLHSKNIAVLDNVKQNENLVTEKINGLTNNLKEADDRCKFLFNELCKVEKERDDLIESDLLKKLAIVEKQEKCYELEDNLKIATDNCRKYKISVNQMQETIKALSDRLFASESEVERLNSVEKKLQVLNCGLEEKIRDLITQQEQLKVNMETMEKEIINDVIKMKNDLVGRLDIIRDESQKEISHLKNVIDMKEQDIINKSEGILNLQLQIDSMQISQQHMDHYVNNLEREKKDLEVQLYEMTEKHFNVEKLLKEKDEKIERLENYLNQKQDDSIKAQTLEMNLKQCHEHIKYLQHMFEETQKAFKEMENKVEQQNRLPSPTVINTLEQQIAQLKDENSELVAKNISLQGELSEHVQQIANLLGHQNHKQKIKHVEQLKLEHRNMKEELDRIRIELAKEKKKNKENSLLKTEAKQLVPSNSRNTSTPVLKDRNV